MAAPKICVDCGQVIAGRGQYYDSEKGPQHKSWLECNDALSALIATQQAELERLRAIEAAARALTAVYPWYVNCVTDKYQCTFCDKLVAFGDKCIHNAGCPWAALESALIPQEATE
jgi:hypothetical protein